MRGGHRARMLPKKEYALLALPKHYNHANIVAYVAAKNLMTMQAVREIIQDYTYAVSMGIINGNKMMFGDLGYLGIMYKPAVPELPKVWNKRNKCWQRQAAKKERKYVRFIASRKFKDLIERLLSFAWVDDTPYTLELEPPEADQSLAKQRDTDDPVVLEANANMRNRKREPQSHKD